MAVSALKLISGHQLHEPMGSSGGLGQQSMMLFIQEFIFICVLPVRNKVYYYYRNIALRRHGQWRGVFMFSLIWMKDE